MSSQKSIRMDLRVSKEDREKLKEMAKSWDCSESYVIRRAITKVYEEYKLIKNTINTI